MLCEIPLKMPPMNDDKVMVEDFENTEMDG